MKKNCSVFAAAELALAAADPADKVDLTQRVLAAWRAQEITTQACCPPPSLMEPGRPVKPSLVHPRELSQRSLTTQSGRIALIHAIAHIEFNAINLALDAVYRFRDLPMPYYEQWLCVAVDEARHFSLLRQRLRQLGSDYGVLPAHDGLWDMARRTAFDPLVRMALVPRVLEARGLDVTPAMITRLQAQKDEATVKILRIILHDEVSHVRCGSYWYRWLCQQRGLEPESHFRTLVADYFNGDLRGPFNEKARLQAGFSAAELKQLAG